MLPNQPQWSLYLTLCWSWADPQVEGEQGPTNSGNPACFTGLPEKKSKLLWLVIEIESSLLIFFYVLHFRIVFLILFSYLHKRQHIGDGHIKKKGPKCSEIRYAFKKAFFSWMWKYIAGLKLLGKESLISYLPYILV